MLTGNQVRYNPIAIKFCDPKAIDETTFSHESFYLFWLNILRLAEKRPP
jgi:hypothetical protein